jgi:hypothetical protein
LLECRAEVWLRRFPLPTGGDHGGGAMYLRYGLSYRDVEELLAERDIEVDHVTIYRWVQRFNLLILDGVLRLTCGFVVVIG